MAVVLIGVMYIAVYKYDAKNIGFNNPIATKIFKQGGATDVHLAVIRGDYDTLLKLINKGVDINVKAADGSTPLHYGCSFGQTRCVELLLDNGANINVQDDSGYTPLATAAYSGNPEIVKLLLSHGARTDIQNNGGYTPLQVTLKFEEALSSLLWGKIFPPTRKT
jgi:ankyrin repeat protein